MADFQYNYNWVPNAKEQRESLTAQDKPRGIASKPKETNSKSKEEGYYEKMLDMFSSFFPSQEEADAVLNSSKPDRETLKESSLEESLAERPGFRSLDEALEALFGDTEKLTTPPSVDTTDIDPDMETLATQDAEENAAIRAASGITESLGRPESAGLMSPPVEDAVVEVDTDTAEPVVEAAENDVPTSSRFDSKGLTPITLTDKAQEKLFDLGFVEVGTADGVAGANTRSAARRYQGASDLTVNGRLDGDTLGSLTSATADLDTIMQRQIAFHEGQKNYPYKDSLGLWTIGVGHLIGRGNDEDLANSGYSQYSRANPMPDSEVTELFQEDLTDHKAIAEGYDFYDDMNEKGKRAIIDLTFNMGDFLNKRNENGTYMWANLREQLANSDWDAAADNLASATYGRQVGQRAITVTDMLRQAGD